MAAERPASDDERRAILGRLPEAVTAARFPQGVASLMLELPDRVVDAGIVLDDRIEDVFVRPLPAGGPASIDTWLGLLDRRRQQAAHDLSSPATGVIAALETVIEYEPIV